LATVVGLRAMLAGPRTWSKVLAVVLIVVAGQQYVEFIRDYWTDYRTRSSFYLGGNLPGAILQASAMQDPHCVYFDFRIPVVSPYWDIYGPPAAPQPQVVDVESREFSVPPSCPSASVVVLAKQSLKPALQSRFTAPGWAVERIPEPDGRVYYNVFQWTSD
jgi:hypothetical protein